MVAVSAGMALAASGMVVSLAPAANAGGPVSPDIIASAINPGSADVQTDTVPTGVCSATINVRGGSGGGASLNLYSYGGEVVGTIPLTAGQAVVASAGSSANSTAGGVGGNGNGGNGDGTGYGGGAGSSLTVAGTLIAVGGGGGGAGANGTGGNGGGGVSGAGAAGNASGSSGGGGGAGGSASLSGVANGTSSSGSANSGGGAGGYSGGSAGSNGAGGGGGSNYVNSGWGGTLTSGTATASAGGGVTVSYVQCAVPTQPTGLTIGSPSGSSVNVSFTPSTTTGTLLVDSYVYSLDNGATWTAFATSGSTTKTGTVSGLAGGTNSIAVAARYNTAAINANGGSSSIQYTLASYGSVNTPPAPPSNVSSSAGQTSGIVQWTNPTSAGYSSTTVTLSPGGQSYTGTATSASFSNLTAGVTYTATVVATGAGNLNSTPVTTSFVPTAGPVTVAGSPTSVSATPGASQVAVSWVAPTNTGGTSLLGYTVTASNGSTCTAGPNATACVVTGLTPGTFYTFTVVANNSAGSSAASSASASVTPTSAPSIPSSVPTTSATLTLSLGINTSAGAKVGDPVLIEGTGFAPNSLVDVYVYSTPTYAGTGTVNANGSFSFTVALPAGLANGQHTVVAAGFDPQGNQKFASAPIRLGDLASTGATTIGPIVAAAGLLGAGALVIVLVLRRRKNQQ